MGRKPKVKGSIINNEIIKYKDEIICQNSQKIAGINADVWKKIADNLSVGLMDKVTPGSVRMRVCRDGGKLLEVLGLVPSSKSTKTDGHYNTSSESTLKPNMQDDLSSDESDCSSPKEKITFVITFSVEEWELIKPREKVYNEKIRGPRTYTMLTPYEWSNVIQDHFFLHTRLPCCLSFTKPYVSFYGMTFVNVNGKCSDCHSMFYGTIDAIPEMNARVIMKCSFHGDFRKIHCHKRRLIGSRKEKIVNAMVNKKTDPSVFVREEAAVLMIEGDVIPAQIPNLGALRAAKHRALVSNRLDSDPIVALNKMKYLKDFLNTIHDIGYDKTFVYFWSNLQLQIYKDYSRKERIITISFDATGGCVRKIKRNENIRSGPIFLYEGVMSIDQHTFTVMSMLSERHDTLSISTWLNRWLRCGVKSPKVVICDQSLALMSALTQTFTQYKSLEQYLQVCFSIVVLKKEEELPTCFIRNDVNHFVHLISQWKEVKDSKFVRSKELIIRGMGLLILCTCIYEAEKILEAIFTIILSKFDGPILSEACNSVANTPCAEKKKFLSKLITNKKNYLEFVEQIDTEYRQTNDDEYGNDNYTASTSLDSFKQWAQSIADKARENTQDIIGQFDNAQFLPSLEKCIVNTMKFFPCWSGIMRDNFGYGTETASSSRIEGNFNQLKNRLFKNESLPLRIDLFLEKLLIYYKGDHLLIQGDNQDWEDGISTENESVHNPVILDRSNIVYENNCVQHTLPTEQDVMIDQYSINDHTSLKCDTREWEDSISFENEPDHVPKTNDSLVFVHNDDNIFQDINKTVERKISDEFEDEIIRISKNINVSDIKIDESKNIEKINKNKNYKKPIVQDISLNENQTCSDYMNKDYPTELHKCMFCKKSLPIFGCSVAISDDNEDYGQKRICKDCDRKKSEKMENNATEVWKKKPLSKKKRSSYSYLVSQTGFEYVDFNKKGSITPIFLLKNGNSFNNKAIMVPGVGKMVLSNTCSVDSMLSILASSAADSLKFKNIIINKSSSNTTAKLILKMISQNDFKDIYYERLLLVLQFFGDKVKYLVGGLKCIDVTDTAASTASKLMADMPSFIRNSRCQNNFCSVINLETTSTMMSLNKFNDEFSIQVELTEYLKESEEKCVYCGHQRISSIHPTTHILVELISLPEDLEASTSVTDIEKSSVTLVRQNFAKPNNTKLSEIEKNLTASTKMYYLQGLIHFHGGERRGLCSATGHYTASAFRGNGKWETYDDTKPTIQNTKQANDVEFLIYTI